jgi:hypothetical protein
MRFQTDTSGYGSTSGRARDGPRGQKEVIMLASIGLGIIGTIIVVALIIAVVLWLLRRA